MPTAKRKRRISLTTRLALAFGVVALLVLGGVGAYLYRALATQVIERDDAELLRKAVRVRNELAESDAGADHWREVSRVVSSNEEYALIIRAPNGEILLAANAGKEPVPGFAPLDAAAPVTPAAIQSWQTQGDIPVRGISGLAPAHHKDGPVRFTIYQTARQRVALMRAYRSRVLGATVLGALVAGGLGYLLLRMGMAPLRRIAAGASTVTVTRLELPVDPARLPPELEELALALQQMMNRLQEGFDRLSQFSADLAHDFRTPIGNLLGQTQVALGAERTADEYQALLASNIEEYERLARMIENMLFVARAENARVAVHPVVLDLARELDGLSDYFEGLAEIDGVAISAEGSGQVLADPLLLRRAVSNLVANAIRYTPAGKTVRMTGRQATNGSVIEVSNPGPGIAPEHLPKLFDRFFRGDPARPNSGESSGVGLAIVRSIMELHHGSVEVESEVNGMTLFRLRFPPTPSGLPASTRAIQDT